MSFFLYADVKNFSFSPKLRAAPLQWRTGRRSAAASGAWVATCDRGRARLVRRAANNSVSFSFAEVAQPPCTAEITTKRDGRMPPGRFAHRVRALYGSAARGEDDSGWAARLSIVVRLLPL